MLLFAVRARIGRQSVGDVTTTSQRTCSKFLGVMAVTATLAGCSSGSTHQAASTTRTTAPASTTLNVSPPPSLTTPTPRPSYQTQGSVTTRDGRFVQYPDGLRVTLTSLSNTTTRLVANDPNQYECTTVNIGACGDYDVRNYRFIRVTMTAKNVGHRVIEVDDAVIGDLYYGANRIKADEMPGVFGNELARPAHEPTQLVPAARSPTTTRSACPSPRRMVRSQCRWTPTSSLYPQTR